VEPVSLRTCRSANSGRRLGGIYLAAVEARLAQKPLQLYAGAAETTIEAEYLKVLIFHATSMDKLQPLGIEIAERLIAYFLPYFSLIREVGRKTCTGSMPPSRCRRRAWRSCPR
jgi:hypothetical protein